MRSGRHISRRRHLSDHGFDLGSRDSAGAQQNRLRFNEREHRRLDTDLAGATLEDEIDVRAQATSYVVDRGWRKLRKAIGAGGGEGHARSLDKS